MCVLFDICFNKTIYKDHETHKDTTYLSNKNIFFSILPTWTILSYLMCIYMYM